MHLHCCKIFNFLLILWQLVFLSVAHRIHVAPECSYCHHFQNGETYAPVRSRTEVLHSRHSGCRSCSHVKTQDGNCHDNEQPPAELPKPHDCKNCSVCQVITAAGTLTAVVTIPKAYEQSATLARAECADPMLGFGYPPQCRAPPAG